MDLCRHATGSVEDYVKKAIELGFESIGMSDHAPFPELTARSIRMYPKDYPEYIRQCDATITKYSDRIKIYKALEIEYFPKHDEMYRKLLGEIDYLALGQHYIEDDSSFEGLRSTYKLITYQHITKYVDTLIKAIDTKYFAFICHPDLMLYAFDDFDPHLASESERLIAYATKNNIPLEINTNGIRKGLHDKKQGKRYLYPRKEFWEIVKEYNARVIVSSDAHIPDHLYDEDVVKAYEFAKDLQIEVEEELHI